MTTKPTSAQIREHAERRMRELGYAPPQPGVLSYEQRLQVWNERWETQLHNAEIFLNRVYELEAERETEAARRDAQALEDQTAELRTGYMSQPGATLEAFQADLPALLAERRRAAALNGPSSRRSAGRSTSSRQSHDQTRHTGSSAPGPYRP